MLIIVILIGQHCDNSMEQTIPLHVRGTYYVHIINLCCPQTACSSFHTIPWLFQKQHGLGVIAALVSAERIPSGLQLHAYQSLIH